ncbi:peptide ABC transporter substrate-binding protein [Amaricoccus sp.]|uniref:peptide ABC transporter substrate-binding protein n=1 Tax=Amaricoccus sp. TaxID=1872485 RepID=UPI001B66A3E0|nr:peptide ABC transporter substrate-binding protein [Amaricoccus sp.]MBP7003397.1 peptide ABC transporter substrate-binding protein [Amaricoccus sp.]
MTLRTMLTGAAALALLAPAAHAERGSDGQVNVLYWQAVSVMTPYLSSGTKDLEAASLVLEPLARFDQDGQLVPYLAQDIPTVENGGVSEDLTTITWKLKEGLLWSDGTPVTADDAVFTWQYCTDPNGGCAQLPNFGDVKSVEAIDPLTIKITFDVPKPYPYGPLVGAQAPLIQKAQFADCLGVNAPTCTEANTKPIGTGPFVVDDFKANDVVTLSANPNFRDPEKPAFANVVLKGGGDAASAARSVLETGEFDYAWNAQVEPEILTAMEAAGKGEVISAFGTLVERIQVNQTDPDPALGEERSTVAHPHPILTDLNVVKALSLAIDRAILIETGYGAAGQMTCNLVPAPDYNASPNNDWCKTRDVDQANKLLDEAGWKMGSDGVREKDGKRLSLLFQTSTNSVRQAAQALIKQDWQQIGVETELRNIDGGVYFGGDPGSPDTFQKFYADVEMYANNFDGTDPEKYLGDWVCSQAPSPANQWQGNNTSRWCSPDYDALHAELGRTAGQEGRAKIAIELNDMIVNSPSFIPLVHRGRVSTKSKALGGVIMNPWDSELWNAADWYREKS